MEFLQMIKTQIAEKDKENMNLQGEHSSINWTKQFINLCPFCRVQSFFSPVSLELHKSICQKTIQSELVAYSRISLMIKSINTMRELKLPLRPSLETAAVKAYETKQEYTLNKTTSETPESSCIEFQSSTASDVYKPAPVVSRIEPGSSTSSLSLEPTLREPVEVTVETISSRDAANPYPKKRTTCQICNKKFRTLMQLAQHTRVVHDKSADTRPHKCPLCPAKFKVSGTLVTHLRTHTGEKPFPCSDCGKRFSQKSALTRHKMIHTGEKPFECMFCHQRFRYKDALASHEIKMHRSPSLVIPSNML